MKTPVLGMFFLCSVSMLRGQATPTASRSFDLQIGGGYALVDSDYYTQRFRGGAIYATVDFGNHFGAEVDFRDAVPPQGPGYEKTYEIGARYHRTYGRFEPYVKGLYGRGVFQYVFDTYDSTGVVIARQAGPSLAYNEFVVGGGTDYRLLRFLNLRADYEYQTWKSFEPHGLTPQALTFGVAYHFPGGMAKGNRFK